MASSYSCRCRITFTKTTVLDAGANLLKDVDCFHPENVGLMVQNRPRFLPCTPQRQSGAARPKYRGTTVNGAHVVVLGRSEIVGKPVGMMLVQKGETVGERDRHDLSQPHEEPHPGDPLGLTS